MRNFSKPRLLAILVATVAFAQPALAQSRTIDDILGSAYVEPNPQPSDTAHVAAGPTPVKLDSTAAALDTASTVKDTTAASANPKDSSATADTTAQNNIDSASIAETSTGSFNYLDSIAGDTTALADSTAKDTTASAEDSSSSGGLVLYEASDSKEKDLKARYRRGELIYKYQATAGWQSPSRGMISLEYIVIPEMLNVGIHFSDYNSDLFQIGAAIQYYPMEMRYFYMFFGSDWIHGEYERERDIGKRVFEEYDESVNYWRVVVGIGGEALFMEHFGAYIEAGFEFFAGDGGYYLHLNKKHGHLTNDSFKLPYGVGVLFPF